MYSSQLILFEEAYYCHIYLQIPLFSHQFLTMLRPADTNIEQENKRRHTNEILLRVEINEKALLFNAVQSERALKTVVLVVELIGKLNVFMKENICKKGICHYHRP